MVEAICQTLEYPELTEIICIDYDSKTNHFDELVGESLYYFQDVLYSGTELESVLFGFLEYEDKRFNENAEDTYVPIGMNASFGGLAPSIDEFETFEQFKDSGMIIVQAAANVSNRTDDLDWAMFYPDVISVGAWNEDQNGDLLVSNELSLATIDILADGYVEKPGWWGLGDGWTFGTSFAAPRVTAGVANFSIIIWWILMPKEQVLRICQSLITRLSIMEIL